MSCLRHTLLLLQLAHMTAAQNSHACAGSCCRQQTLQTLLGHSDVSEPVTKLEGRIFQQFGHDQVRRRF